MDIFAAIETRATALQLGEPGPSPEHLERILSAGIHAPDHGRLKPWRFVVIEGEARDRLGDAMAAVRLKEAPQAGAAELDAIRQKARRAPTIVVAAAAVTQGGKIPEIEQVISVGTGVQNMCLAAHALGYGAMWKTGGPAYDPQVKDSLGLGVGDHIVAFLYLGTLVREGLPKPRSLEGLVRRL